MPDTWSFAMATPDTLLGHHLDFVLDRIRTHGLEVTACRLLQLDVPRMARMYTHSDTPPPRSNAPRTGIELPDVVTTQMYALAPACILMVRREENASQALLTCKGATRPDAAKPDSIRAAGENAILNLLHCPDDPPSAAIELAYLVGAEEADALRHATPAIAPLVCVEQLRLCLPAFSGWQALSFPLIANRLRNRIIQHLAPRLGPLDSFLEAQAALRAEHDALLNSPTPAERLRIAQDAHPQIHAALRAVTTGPMQVGLDALAELYDAAGTRRLGPILALRQAGIYLSALEQMVLDAHRHAFWSDQHPIADVSE